MQHISLQSSDLGHCRLVAVPPSLPYPFFVFISHLKLYWLILKKHLLQNPFVFMTSVAVSPHHSPLLLHRNQNSIHQHMTMLYRLLCLSFLV